MTLPNFVIVGLFAGSVLATSARAQHAPHVASPIPMDFVHRAMSIRSGIGRAHDTTSTRSQEAQALYDQGLAYLHAYVWIEAARSFNAALRIDAGLALAHVGLSVAYVELSRPAEARKALAAARALASGLTDHERQHLDLRALQMAAEDSAADATRLAAYRSALDKAVAAWPGDVELILLRGHAESADPAERGQGSHERSVPHYQRAMEQAPDHSAPHHYLTHAYENAGRLEDALRHAAAFAIAAPAIPHARHMHGHNLLRSGHSLEAVVEFEAADRLHRRYAVDEGIAVEYDWHFEHNLGLLASSLLHTGQVRRAEPLLKAAFALPTTLLVQAYHKRGWPQLLRARGRHQDALAASRALIAHPHPLVQAAGHIEAGFTMLALQRFADGATESNAALRLLRTAPGGPMAAAPLLALQGEFNLRTAARAKGRAMLEEAVSRARSLAGPDNWIQTLFLLEHIASAARSVGDWELAGQMARQMIDHDGSYAGSHYASGLVAEHASDQAAARDAFAHALERWVKADADLPELVDTRRKLSK